MSRFKGVVVLIKRQPTVFRTYFYFISDPNGKANSTQETVNNRHADINKQLEECTKITQETENQLQKVCRLQEYMMITRSHLEVYG